jgi:proteic killer suppression protein
MRIRNVVHKGLRRKGTWSLFVTKNWRLTFRIDRSEIEIIDLDYEDYH